MPAQITLWRANGINDEYPAANNDDDRGQKLLDATNDAQAGDTVIAGPGHYLKKGSITKDGVKIHLLPGARIYTPSINDGPLINVTAGIHALSGHGVIEHLGVSPASPVQTITISGGVLVCEADEIICADQAAINLVGAAAILYLNARRVLAKSGVGLNLGSGTCYARVQHLVADGTAAASPGININGGNANSVRIVKACISTRKTEKPYCCRDPVVAISHPKASTP